jgi:hypothetical protein
MPTTHATDAIRVLMMASGETSDVG